MPVSVLRRSDGCVAYFARALQAASASASNAVPPTVKAERAPTRCTTRSHITFSLIVDLGAAQVPSLHFHTVVWVMKLAFFGASAGVAV